MRKLVAGLLSLAMLAASLGYVRAETDLLETLIESVDQIDRIDDQATVCRILTSHGYQIDNSDPNNFYDAILDVCEQEYGSYYGWNVTRRYKFDSLMVRLGQLPYCINLDPTTDILNQEEALNVALTEIIERFGRAYDTSDYTVVASYTATQNGSTQGMWRFSVEIENEDFFVAHVLHGNVTYCVKKKKMDALDAEYNELCEKRGAFFKWSLYEKMEFAESLPDKLRIAQEENERCMNYDELVAISQYGFGLPGADDLPQENAKLIALQNVQAKYNLQDDWYVNAEVFYSFFSDKMGGSIWRVIIWKTGNGVFPSGLVELNSETGEVLKIEKNGTTFSEFIPYLDRI